MDAVDFNRHPMRQQRHTPLNQGRVNTSLYSPSSPVNISSILNTSPLKSARESPVKCKTNYHLTKCKCHVSSNGLKETFISLALLCFVSLFTALLSLLFLQKTCSLTAPLSSEVSSNIHQSKSASNDVTSTRVSSVEEKEYMKFLSGAKLLKTPQGTRRTIDFFKKTSNCRLVAIAAFALSIPIFFTGLVLFVFVNFDEVAAITTSFAIAIGIIFCGVACVQTVYLWQDAKTKSVHQLNESTVLNNVSPLNSTVKLQLSTLV